ncbi:TPA: sugar-phosphatase [Streptococcus suis]|nr:sugar-phosphatase [Streptococcus suis]MBY5022293.1 sugar-phosphatase [Streptococcus suis]MCQ8264928.1 sugar-phosphatase [Streptococcus suis]HEL1584015.1 sugar-phosphatase [Streptococcus suis]HEL1639797.1 sugar-phosphatase [Streptococcus suis]
MTIKLVAIDIDGTLLNSQHQITPEVFQAVQEAKAAGVKIVITTGRPLTGVKKILSELNLLEQGDYVITFNGGLVQETATGQEVLKESLRYEDYMEIEYLSRQLGLHLHVSTKDGMYTANRQIGKYTMYEASLVDSPVYYHTPEEMAGKEMIKAMMVDEPEKIDQALPSIPASFFDKYNVAKSAPFYLEITPKTVSKGQAIIALATELGLTMEQTMAIGDQENDRPMLEVVANPVVMENGNPELKKIAKYITKSNDESGVAYAIREWVLK